MNFFASQERARKATRWLVVLYLLALLLITFFSSWVLLILLRLFGVQSPSVHGGFFQLNPSDGLIFSAVATFVLLGAFISSYIKARELSEGGKGVALSLGGQKILANTRDLHQRQVLNVVEEMAIASGMPTPDVYILPDEDAINAFAAGLTPTDAVIGLTQGAVDKLNRAQLQGVVGHEFSHILNGDMRLNIRLIMLVTGIEFVGLVGRVLSGGGRLGYVSRSSRSSSRGGKRSGVIVLVGIALRLIGWLGGLFGRMIQAAVSRQREYLADASAVQFTRNPSAVADALKVIGGDEMGTRLIHTDSTQFTHLFFGQVFRTPLNFLFATHPPLAERIALLQPDWDGQFLPPAVRVMVNHSNQPNDTVNPPKNQQSAFLETLATAATVSVAGELAVQMGLKNKFHQGHQTTEAKQANEDDYRQLAQQAQDPSEAMGLVLATLLLNSHDSVSDTLKTIENLPVSTQLALHQLMTEFAQNRGIPGLEKIALNWLMALPILRLEQRLRLIEGALPALKEMSDAQYQDFKKLMNAIVELDGQTDIYEQTIMRLVSRFLEVHFGLAKPNRVLYKRIQQVHVPVRLLLSMLAFYGHDNVNGTDSELQIEAAFQAGLKACGLEQGAPVLLTAYSDNDFNHATEKLAHCSLAVKNQIMLGLQACIEHDGQIANVERELILAISATLDAPIPRFKI